MAHITAGNTPIDISDGLEGGRYVASVRGAPGALRNFVYHGAKRRLRMGADYSNINAGEKFEFLAGDRRPNPTWVRNMIPGTVDCRELFSRLRWGGVPVVSEFLIFDDGDLEIRARKDGGKMLSGKFPYGKIATIRDRGRVRKERIGKRAFRLANKRI